MIADNPTVLRAKRNALFEAAGAGRDVVRVLLGLLALTTLAAIAMGFLAWREAKLSGDRVERYVVPLGPDSEVLATLGIASNWVPETGAYVDFAKRWVRGVRIRPLDPVALNVLRREADMAIGDPRLRAQVHQSMSAADEAAGPSAIDVNDIGAQPIGQVQGNTALLLVRWSEQVRTASSRPTVYTATLKVVYQKPVLLGEFKINPLGLYATEFQPSREK